MRALAALIFATPMLLAGCATNQLQVTYYSDPPGATVVRPDGTTLGRAPLSLNYSISDADRARGQKTLQGLTAQWVSGARVAYSTINADLKIGSRMSFTFKRPQNSPGLATDMQYALELEKLAEMRRQTSAQEDAAYEARRAASAAEESANAAKRKSSNVTCTGIGISRVCM